MLRPFCGVLLLAASLALPAQAPVELPPVEVRSTRLPAPGQASTLAVSRVQTAQLAGDPGLALDEVLNRVAGVYAQNRYNLNQGLRVSIRGFGSRASFGVRGLRVLLDGIPLTNPDGQTDLDALDLALIERADVLRGPASALYGNGAGGVLALHSRSAPDGEHVRVDLRLGSLGEQQLRAETGGRDPTREWLLALARREVRTHRTHMAAERFSASGRGVWQLAGGELDAAVQTLDIRAQDPGGLTRAEAAAQPGGANPAALRFDAGETIRQTRASLAWAGALDAGSSYRVQAWAGVRDFANRLPFANGGQTEFARRLSGISSQLEHRGRYLGLDQQFSLGADLETQTDDRTRYQNLEGGRRGAQTLAQDERARSTGVFLGHRLLPDARWIIDTGLRHDTVRLAAQDRSLDDGDDSGRRLFRQTSAHLGLGYRPAAGSLVFMRYGTGFESPTLNELANPAGGGFNPALQPAQARQLELGIRHQRATWRTELSVYEIRLDEELLRFELPDQPGRSFFRNAGRGQRQGLEASLAWQATARLELTLAYTAQDFRLRSEGRDGTDLSGRHLPGVPRQQGFAEAALRLPQGWTTRLQAVAQDRVFADDANRERVPGYWASNLRLSHELQQGSARMETYLALNNLLDQPYTDNLRTNAAFGRYYEPAAGRVLLGGVSVWF